MSEIKAIENFYDYGMYIWLEFGGGGVPCPLIELRG